RHAMVVHDARAVPEFLDMAPRALDTATSLSADDDSPDLGRRQVDVLLARHLRQPDSISGGATENSRAGVHHGVQPRGAAHSAAGDTHGTHASRCFERGPKTQKRP